MNARFLLPLAAHRWNVRNYSFIQQEASCSGPTSAVTERVDRSAQRTDTVVGVPMGQLDPRHIRDDYLATPRSATGAVC